MKLDTGKILGLLIICIGVGLVIAGIILSKCPPLSKHQEQGHWQFDIVNFDKKLVACKDCKVVLLRDGPDHQGEWDQWEKLRNSQ